MRKKKQMMLDEMSSVFSNGPSEDLLNAVKSNKLKLFKKLLKSPYIDLHNTFREPYRGRILDVCCESSGRSLFVKELLSTGRMDVNGVTENEKKAAIHFAAMHGNKDVLKVLLKHPATDVNILDGQGNSPLHLATTAGSVECVTLLLQSKGIKLNQLNREGTTPAYIAATLDKQNNELITVFVRCPEVDFEITVDNKSLKQVLTERWPKLAPFVYLYSRDEDGFVSCVSSTKQYEGDDGEYTYLQYACAFGLAKVARELLEQDGVDPNERIRHSRGAAPSHDNAYPLFMAAANGYAEIIRSFVDSEKLNIIYQMNGKNTTRIGRVSAAYNTSALHLVIENSIKKSSTPRHNADSCDYDESFEILSPVCCAIDVDFADSRGDTCLHSAAYVENCGYVHRLLDRGASLGKRNRFGTSPLDNIGLNTMRSYLDNCVRSNGACTENDDYEITFSYEFLCSLGSYKYRRGAAAAAAGRETVITKIRPETDQLYYLSKCTKFKSLLQHPVLTTIVNTKWSVVNRLYFYNLFFYMIFLYTLTALIVCDTEISCAETKTGRFLFDIHVYFFLLCLLILTVRELYQFTLSPINYLLDIENWLEISIIFVSINFLIFGNPFKIPYHSRTLYAIVILTSWGEFILLLGKHPMFAVPLAMFKLVSKNILKFLLWYSMLIFAFILSFHMLFYRIDEDQTTFDSLFLTAFKTIIMLTGEFESSDLPFDSSVVSRLVFALFVFLVSIVLVNLLNGLAVSDTQKIQKDAEIIVIAARLHFIYSVETISVSQNFIRYLMTSLCIRLFHLNIILFPDPGSSKLTIFPNQKKCEFRSKGKGCCEVNSKEFVVDGEVIHEAKAIIKAMTEEHQKDREKDVKALIEEISNNINKCLSRWTEK